MKTDTIKQDTPFFIFDVESIGLHGEGFAVAGGVYIDGAAQHEFCYCCPTEQAAGTDEDREWVSKNVPVMEVTHRSTWSLREEFWWRWDEAKKKYPGIQVAAECLWPVEAAFFAHCVNHSFKVRNFEGPYPFHEIASFMLAAGMDPMATYERTPSESPAHNPLADARQSARLLAEAIRKVIESQPAELKP